MSLLRAPDDLEFMIALLSERVKHLVLDRSMDCIID